MKKVIYTCITGKYDTLIEPDVITEGFDYICFTDNKELKSGSWEIRLLEGDNELSNVKKQRHIKICPHEFLKEYDLSIWVDGNVRVKGDMNKYIDAYCSTNLDVYIPYHPCRDCIYEEMKTCQSINKDTIENMQPQIDRYKSEEYPKHYGLVQSNIIIRRHNRTGCIKLMNDWWNEVKNGSHRDQLSFNYALWKNPKSKFQYLGFKTCNSEYFKWEMFHRGKNKTAPIQQQEVSTSVDNIGIREANEKLGDMKYLLNNLNKISAERERKKKKLISFYRR